MSLVVPLLLTNPLLFHKDYRKVRQFEAAVEIKDNISAKSVNSVELEKSAEDNETMFELSLEDKKENHYFYDITALLKEPVRKCSIII